MKKVFKSIGIFLSVALMGAFSSCIPQADNDLADLGLGIKVFFPTKVVAGQPMTINGSGFMGVSEIVFPGDVTVTDFEIVSNDMIRVTAPAGIAADGGHLVVRTAEDAAESPLPLTLGRTNVSGFSAQAGEELEGGQQITVYGTDLEFINGFEILDPDGNPLLVPQEAFYRKGTSSVIITLPKKIFEGSYVAKLHTYDGRTFELPELSYKLPTDGGHWEKQEITIWDTETVFADWSATLVIDPSNFADAKAGDIIRIYIKDKTSDYNPIFKHVDSWGDWAEFQSAKVDEDGYFEAPIPAEALDELKQSGLRFQGIGFTVVKATLFQEVWVGGGGHLEVQEVTVWDTETVFGDWSATLVIDPSNFADAKAGDIIRVYIKDKTSDYNPIFKHVDSWGDWAEFQSAKVDEDGYFEAPIPAEALDELKQSGLRFQGLGFTVVKATVFMEVMVGGGDSAPTVQTIWDTETVFSDWSATILIGPEKFADVKAGAIVRVYIKDKSGDYNPIYKHEDWSDWNEFQSNKVDEDGYFEAPVPAEAIAELQEKGLRFQGIGFTIVKVELIP